MASQGGAAHEQRCVKFWEELAAGYARWATLSSEEQWRAVQAKYGSVESFVRSTKKYWEDPMNAIVVFSHFEQASGGIKGQCGKGDGKGGQGALQALEKFHGTESDKQGEYLEGGKDGKGVAAVMQSASSS